MRLLRMGIIMNHKKISRLMDKFNLFCPIRKANPIRRMAKAMKTSNYTDNILNRHFDEMAVKEILKFYDGYISKLCLRPFYHSESGKIIMQVDEELKGEIHTDMMKAILKFEIGVK